MKNKIKLIFGIALIFLVGTISFVFAYTAPNYDSVNFELEGGYSAPNYNNINLVLGDITDTCTYSGSGNWKVTCSDNCSITSNVDLGGNNLTLSNDNGYFKLDANITNFDKIIKHDNCELRIFGGFKS